MHSLPANPASRRAYSLAEAADMCGVSYHTIYRAVCRGHLKVLTGFGRLMVSDQELNRFLSKAEEYHGKRGE
jgi:predicted site-specific integrase-resolvase